MAKKFGPNKENLEATRRKFLDIARREFSESGYHAASTAKIVAESGMARGSLYYHFGDKRGLFRAVYDGLTENMRGTIRARIVASPDPWTALIDGCLTCLDLCTERETRRIIIDVHTALAYQERMDILNRTLLAELTHLLRAVMKEGYFRGHDVDTLSIMTFGLISETARSFELAGDVGAARALLGENIVLFLENARGTRA